MNSHAVSLPPRVPTQNVVNQAAQSAPVSVSPTAQPHGLPNGPYASFSASPSLPSAQQIQAPSTTASAGSGSVTPPLPFPAHLPSAGQGVPPLSQMVAHAQPPNGTHAVQTQLPSHSISQQTQFPNATQPHQHHHNHPPSTGPPLLLSQLLPEPVRGDVASAKQSLPSPTQAVGREKSDEYQRLSAIISASSPDSVRQAVRDYWEKAILGSQYHIAFLLIATMQQADNDTLCRAVKDFGGRMINASKEHVVQHLKTEDIDEIADGLLAKASSTFLDKALARRLETIPARQLVNALARAERLGYDVQDIVEEEQGGGEHVIPSLHSLVVTPSAAQSAAPLPVPAPVPSQQRPNYVASYPGTPVQPTPHGAPNPVSAEAGPTGVVYCDCGWPCSSKKALDNHQKKRACDKWLESDQLGKELCAHCGCRFTSPGGLYYHGKVSVCGAYTPEQTQRITALVAAFRQGGNASANQTATYQTPSQTPSQTPLIVRQYEKPVAQTTPISAMRSGKTAAESEAYANLTPQQRHDFEAEMKSAEAFYGNLMRQAMSQPEPEKTKQLAALKNRYNTKQSVTRKKYGIRLRERRSRAEIDAERTRLFGTPDGPSLSGRDGASPAQKRARVGENGDAMSTGRADDASTNTPRKRVPLAEMGGLTGSSATAELHDPTASLVAPQSQTGQQKPQFNPVPERRMSGTQADPMSIDDDSASSESDNDDIPASL